MSFTLSTLKTAIQDYLETDETTFVANLDNFILQAEERILKSVQVPDQRKNVQGSVSTDVRFLTTPSDFLAPFSLAVISSNTYDYLDLKHNSFIKEFVSDTSTRGKPRYYAIFDQSSFEVAPVPDENYTVELHYLATPTSLTAGADSGTTYLSTDAPDTLLYGCLLEGAVFLKLGAADIGLYEARFKESLLRLKNLGEGRDTRDEMRYDSLRTNVT
jgi:hypothetical protein|tara:strand:+ start:2198 stop:2845 length:648 start_codon:yes stop_codon:yes gene_type:complete